MRKGSAKTMIILGIFMPDTTQLATYHYVSTSATVIHLIYWGNGIHGLAFVSVVDSCHMIW